MELIGGGRDSQVFALDERRVLRRAGFDASGEARTMRHARGLGFPAPEVFEVSADGDLIMERLHGPTLAAEVAAGRIEPEQAASCLFDLHDRLHRIEAPEWLPTAPRGVELGGRSLLHLDLHPENVIVTGEGPHLIDWTNAAAGEPGVDFGGSWAIMAGVDPAAFGPADGPIAARIGRLCAALAERVPTDAVDAALAFREADPNVDPAEIRTLRSKARSFAA